MTSGLYSVAKGALPQASDVNQLVKGLQGTTDLGQVTLFAVLTNPTGTPTSVANGSGNLTGTYGWVATECTGGADDAGNVYITGETLPTPVSAALTLSSNQATVGNLPTGTTGVVAVRVYRNTASGSATTGPFYLVQQINNNTTASIPDNVPDSSLGYLVTTVNTTGTVISGGTISGATLSGTFAGTPTYSGLPTFSAGIGMTNLANQVQLSFFPSALPVGTTLPLATTVGSAYGFGTDTSGTLYSIAPLAFKFVAAQNSVTPLATLTTSAFTVGPQAIFDSGITGTGSTGSLTTAWAQLTGIPSLVNTLVAGTNITVSGASGNITVSSPNSAQLNGTAPFTTQQQFAAGIAVTNTGGLITIAGDHSGLLLAIAEASQVLYGTDYAGLDAAIVTNTTASGNPDAYTGDATYPQWRLRLQSSQDSARITRVPPGGTAESNMVAVDNAGNLTAAGTVTAASGQLGSASGVWTPAAGTFNVAAGTVINVASVPSGAKMYNIAIVATVTAVGGSNSNSSWWTGASSTGALYTGYSSPISSATISGNSFGNGSLLYDNTYQTEGYFQLNGGYLQLVTTVPGATTVYAAQTFSWAVS